MDPAPSNLGIAYLKGHFHHLQLNAETNQVVLGAPIGNSAINLGGLQLELDSTNGEAIYGHAPELCRVWDMKKHEALLFTGGIVRTYNLLDVLFPPPGHPPPTCH